MAGVGNLEPLQEIFSWQKDYLSIEHHYLKCAVTLHNMQCHIQTPCLLIHRIKHSRIFDLGCFDPFKLRTHSYISLPIPSQFQLETAT